MGYHRAGFDEIVGVDINVQPNYPFTFIQGDALRPPVRFEDFDLVHASPPCQAYSTLSRSWNARTGTYPDLVAPIRHLLERSGLPYIIENVLGAPLLNPVQLCGSSFGLRHDGFELRRHRLFETSFPLMVPACAHELRVSGVYGDLSKNRRAAGVGRMRAGIRDAAELMGIDWMTPAELTEAIPPAYTEYLGAQFLAQYPVTPGR